MADFFFIDFLLPILYTELNMFHKKLELINNCWILAFIWKHCVKINGQYMYSIYMSWDVIYVPTV